MIYFLLGRAHIDAILKEPLKFVDFHFLALEPNESFRIVPWLKSPSGIRMWTKIDPIVLAICIFELVMFGGSREPLY